MKQAVYSVHAYFVDLTCFYFLQTKQKEEEDKEQVIIFQFERFDE